ncbi:MAG: hypothetical protein Q8M16_20615 [Pirellulaceae bacterium]|nr:hypothetical protein [Pirellulaceae bacterium]
MAQLQVDDPGQSRSTHVLKLGGSLLQSPDLPNQVGRWWQHLRDLHVESGPVQWLVVVGGGTVVDAVRAWDRVHSLSPRDSHRLALAGMQVTARMVARLMEWPLLEFPAAGAIGGGKVSPEGPDSVDPMTRSEMAAWTGTAARFGVERPLVVDLAAAAAADRRFPESWDVTSDSLAMWLATQVRAKQLVLLKAVSPLENPVKIGKISDLGWVDAFFSRMWSEEPGIQVEIAHFSHYPQISQVHVILQDISVCGGTFRR